MAVRVGINGFGRIGRNFFRAAVERGADFEIVAVNDLGDAKTMAHLLKYDSNLGPLEGEVEAGDGVIRAAGKELKVLSERDPAALPWGDLGVERRHRVDRLLHQARRRAEAPRRGARKVVISAPATEPDVTLVLGVNDEQYDPDSHHVSPTRRARRTAWRRSPRCSTTRSPSSRAS